MNEDPTKGCKMNPFIRKEFEELHTYNKDDPTDGIKGTLCFYLDMREFKHFAVQTEFRPRARDVLDVTIHGTLEDRYIPLEEYIYTDITDFLFGRPSLKTNDLLIHDTVACFSFIMIKVQQQKKHPQATFYNDANLKLLAVRYNAQTLDEKDKS